ncbi:hypothetical protein FACS189483_08460 [Spirochaetia bacterium]|nr:hypothetical protein FACS189483_08460 [Spirochaetia bacterium]
MSVGRGENGNNTLILFAAADSADTVTVALPNAPDDFSVFSVYDAGRKLAGSSAKGKTNKQVVITLREDITDPAVPLVVRDESGSHPDKPVTMRRILDSYYYGGDDLGLRYTARESGFKVWAPTAVSVSVALFDDSGTYDANGKVTGHEGAVLHGMNRDAKTGVWSAVVPGDLAGKFYRYRLEFAAYSNGGAGNGAVTWAVDPYARAVSANGQRTAIIDPADTNPALWRPDFKPPFSNNFQDAILYELHVRDFSLDENSGMRNRGKFLAFTERGTKNSDGVATGVDHLVNLGITHVHLLPSYDYASINELTVDDPASKNPKFNWGYDPQNYNVPEGSYSSDPRDPAARVREFKAMVQSLHDAGIRVVMDVVYNHTYQTGNDGPFDALVPGYYYRTTDTGTYSNGSACGNEVASERPMVSKFIIDSCLYWAKEYNVDGFRFDLMALIDTPTMVKLTEAVRRQSGENCIIYGEPWQAGGSVLPPQQQTNVGDQRGLGFAIFNDRIRTALKGGSDDATRGFVTGLPGQEAAIVRGVQGSVNDITNNASESINYVTAHDNLNLWDKVALSLGAKNLATNPYEILIPGKALLENEPVQAAILANGIILTSQGIPFFQAGDEMLRSKYGDHNSYASSDEINRIRWENAGRYREVFEYHAGLIRLRKEHPAFRMNTKAEIEQNTGILSATDGVVAFVLKDNANGDSWQTIVVAYNGSTAAKTVELPAAAVWCQVVNGQQAGTTTLTDITGDRVTLPALSMAVLHD